MRTLIETLRTSGTTYANGRSSDDIVTDEWYSSTDESSVVASYKEVLTVMNTENIDIFDERVYYEGLLCRIIKHPKCPDWVKVDWFHRYTNDI